jgi:predicted Zn-dependent protease with MMP-like domain
MQSPGTVGVKSEGFNRRPRSRGLPAPHTNHHSFVARLRLYWMTMPTVPRLLIMAVIVIGVAYGLVVIFASLPVFAEWIYASFLLPWCFYGLTVWFLADGEPNDQDAVHVPDYSDLGLGATSGVESIGRDAEGQDLKKMSDQDFDALEDQVDAFSKGAATMAPKKLSDKDFNSLEDRVETLSSKPRPADADAAGDDASTKAFDPAHDADDFRKLVSQAIDELPPEFTQALDHVAVMVSDQGAFQRRNGRSQPLLGLYVGYGKNGSFLGAPRPANQPDRIIVFRDTLTRSYGDDTDRLREEVTRTLRHELAHHLGYDEPGVHALGL